MTSPEMFVIVTVATAIFFLLWRKRSGHLPPGPLGLPLLGNLPFLRPDLHRYFADLARTHGPIMSLRLGSKLCVVLSSPAAAKEALKDKDTILANHDVPTVARICFQGGTDMLWSPYGPHWRMIRKVAVLHLLGPTSVDNFYPVRRREVRRAIGELRSRAGEEVNVREVLLKTTLNVVVAMLWGGGAGEGDGFWEVADGIVELLGVPNVSDFFPALGWLDLQGMGKKARVLSARLDRVFHTIVDERIKSNREGDEISGGGGAGGGEKNKDFLQVMLELVGKGDPQAPVTIDHVKVLFLDIIGAGTETSTSSLEWALSELLRHKESMARVQQELDTVVGKEAIVEESHISNLHYLNAVVKETLRLYPVAPFLIPHAPSSPCTLGGYDVPKDTGVIINVWAIQRDPSLWEEPLEFKPERFLFDEFEYYSGKDFRYFPFGSGRRICAGALMAKRFMVYMLASLLHSFEWKLPEGSAGVEFDEKLGIALKKSVPLVAVPIER